MGEMVRNTVIPFSEYLGFATSGPFAIWDKFISRDFKQFRRRLGLSEPQMDAVNTVFPALHLLPFDEGGTRGGLEGSKNIGPGLRRHYIPTLAALIFFGIKDLAVYQPGETTVTLEQLHSRAVITVDRVRKALRGEPEVLERFPEIVGYIQDPKTPVDPETIIKLASQPFNPGAMFAELPKPTRAKYPREAGSTVFDTVELLDRLSRRGFRGSKPWW